MTIDPNNLQAIKQSNDQAIPKGRVRDPQRTPDSNKKRAGKYPMVNSQEFVGGHKLTFDSTPGARTVEIYHGSGTYVQISEDGMTTKVCVGNSHDHFKEGVTITVDQNEDKKINGHSRISITGGSHIEIAGDANLVVAGDMNHFVGGNYNAVVSGDFNMQVSGSVNQTAGGDNTNKAGGNMKMKAAKIDLN